MSENQSININFKFIFYLLQLRNMEHAWINLLQVIQKSLLKYYNDDEIDIGNIIKGELWIASFHSLIY